MSQSTQAQHSISHSDFILLISTLIHWRDRIAVPSRIGKLVAAFDIDEEHFHVETHGEQSVLWTLRDWNTHAANLKYEHDLAHLERAVNVNLTECRDILVRKLRRLDAFMYLDEDVVKEMAWKLVLARNWKAMLLLVGSPTFASDLMRADDELAAFKQTRASAASLSD